MGSQKRHLHIKRVIDVASKTELCKGWTCYNALVAYEINSRENEDNQTRDISTHSQDSGVATRSHHLFPSVITKADLKQPSLIEQLSICAHPEDVHQSKMLLPSCSHFPENVRTALMFAVQHPPVGVATLNELDLNCILHNINLRSDINFENDLHFMPVKGKRAEQKREEAQEYWLALAAELKIHLHTRLECPPSHHDEQRCAPKTFTPRLHRMFADLRDLLETLVPDRDHISISENLDVPFVMQQIENGVLDIPRLARWLASLLKSHCAPMRDEWADQMTRQIEEGAQKIDMALLVKGIERLFSVLEAMKLDVANHQIRTFRFHLMEDTISFQQKFFAKRIMDGKIDAGPCGDWYNQVRQQRPLLPYSTAPSLHAYASLIHGMIGTLFSNAGTRVLPKSFQFDLKRLERLRVDVQDLIHLKTGRIVFDELRSWLVSGQPMSVTSDTYAELQSRMLAIVDEQQEDGDLWQISLPDVALEITRAACASCGQSQAIIPDFLIRSTLLRIRDLISGQQPETSFIWDTAREELTREAIHHAQVFYDMTPLAISEAQQNWQQQQEQRTSFRPLPYAEDIARRLAHVGVLHWKIWANLVYLDDAEEASAEQAVTISPPSSTQRGDLAAPVSNVINSVEMVVE